MRIAHAGGAAVAAALVASFFGTALMATTDTTKPTVMATTTPATAPATRPRGVVADGATLQTAGKGYAFTEGPSADADGNVYFTDQPNDRILRWAAKDGAITTFLHPAGRSNGTCFDGHGNLIACADQDNQLWQIATDGTHAVLVKDFDGKLLNGPNDVWVAPDGGMYLTDPMYKRDYWTRDATVQLAGEFVFYLPPGKTGAALRPVATDLKKPNGIIGTPDGKRLYVADIGADQTFRYDLAADGSLANKHLFCPMGSDGMTIDDEENLYLTGHGVTVFDKAGRQVEHIPIDQKWTGNVCFGGTDRRTLFITASKAVYTIRTRTKGVGSQ